MWLCDLLTGHGDREINHKTNAGQCWFAGKILGINLWLQFVFVPWALLGMKVVAVWQQLKSWRTTKSNLPCHFQQSELVAGLCCVLFCFPFCKYSPPSAQMGQSRTGWNGHVEQTRRSSELCLLLPLSYCVLWCTPGMPLQVVSPHAFAERLFFVCLFGKYLLRAIENATV